MTASTDKTKAAKDKAPKAEEVPAETQEEHPETEDGGETPETEETASKEVERLLPESPRVELSDGTEVEVVPMKTRQFFRLLKIVTRGGAPILRTMPLNITGGGEEFAQQLLAVVMMAVPEAEQQTVEFLQSMVEPIGLTGDPDIDKAKRLALDEFLWNPELEDTFTILEKIVAIEGEDIRALGNRMARMFSIAEKTGQIPK